MSSRHQPIAGADSAEYADPRDVTCDYCGRLFYQSLLHKSTIAGTYMWRCEECYQRDLARYDAMLDEQERGVGSAA